MTLQDWMTRGSTRKEQPVTETPEPAPEPKPNRWATAPDSDWLSAWAQIALEAGRIEMGHQLASLAVRAYRYEQHPKPLHAAPDPDPMAAGEDMTTQAPAIHAEPDTAVGTATAPPAITPNGRCVMTTPGGMACHAVAFYDPGRNAWTHMDGALDQLHIPVVPHASPTRGDN